MSTETRKISDIQILRGIAITLVIICHMSFSATLLGVVSGSLSDLFYVGVEMFFIISGFVVTNSLRRGEYEAIGFLIRRVFRLYPPILLFLVTAAVINLALRMIFSSGFPVDFFGTPRDAFVAQAMAILGGYLINLPGGGSGYMNGAMWSLSVEFQFYFVVTGIAMLMTVGRLTPAMKEKVGFLIAAVVLTIGIVARLLMIFGLRIQAFSYLIDFRFDFMALGVFLAYWQSARPMRLTVSRRPGL